MEISNQILVQSGLFAGISRPEIETMMNCLRAREVKVKKGEMIYRDGDFVSEAGLILDGTIHRLQEDYWGNRNIVAVLQAGDVFGEVSACLGTERIEGYIRAETDCRILFINLRKAMHTCHNTCLFHQRLVENLLYLIARKNLNLTAKLQTISKRSIREKVLAYLLEESRKQRSLYVTIPLTRQQMADFLAVDRSALSKELARMKTDRLIEYERNHFRLITR